jgi:hypothetical protein
MSIYVLANEKVKPFRGVDGLYHFVYMTKNLVSLRCYVGKHTTKDYTTDDYIGSGTLLTKAVKRYGRESFSCVILGFCVTSDAAYDAEERLVTEEDLLDGFLYNLVPGGKRIDSNFNVVRELSTNKGKVNIRDKESGKIKKMLISDLTPELESYLICKRWEVTYPDGKVEIIDNLAAFCRRNGLNKNGANAQCRGEFTHHRGFKFRKWDDGLSLTHQDKNFELLV